MRFQGLVVNFDHIRKDALFIRNLLTIPNFLKQVVKVKQYDPPATVEPPCSAEMVARPLWQGGVLSGSRDHMFSIEVWSNID